jgi:hypothetical protein
VIKDYQDDRKSLHEPHQYLNSDSNEPSFEDIYQGPSRKSSITSSLKSERRRSLPTRASMGSIGSEFTPEVSDFQMRRRRAAKLQNFFGVDYNDLIHDVLESIEKGVEDEGKRGTLNPAELQVDFFIVLVRPIIDRFTYRTWCGDFACSSQREVRGK